MEKNCKFQQNILILLHETIGTIEPFGSKKKHISILYAKKGSRTSPLNTS